MPESNDSVARADGARLAGMMIDSWAQSSARDESDSAFDFASAPQLPGYRVIRELGRGGQAVVYQAVQESTGHCVAVKFLREGRLADARQKARFEREADLLRSLHHPGIVSAIDTGTTQEGWLYLITEFVEGRRLDDHFRSFSGSPRESLELFLKICDIVGAAHRRGIVHRDLKPANILVDAEFMPHVLDFGLARGFDPAGDRGSVERMTMTGQILGSIPWTSPEQAEGRVDAFGPAADVYSLGVILYQILAGGRFPYDVGGPAGTVLRNISRARPASLRRRSIATPMRAVVWRALAKRPEARFADAGALAAAVKTALEGSASRPVPRQRLLTGALVGLLLLCALWVSWRRYALNHRVAVNRFTPTLTHPTDFEAIECEFLVSTFPTDDSTRPMLDCDADGNSVIVWEQTDAPNRRRIGGRRYDPIGRARGSVFWVNSRFGLDQYEPVVSVDPMGNFVVAWTVQGVETGKEVHAQRFDIAGRRVGVEETLNSYRPNDKFAPAVKLDRDGSYIAAWQSDGQDGDGFGIFARGFDAAKGRLGHEFQVNQTTRGEQTKPAICLFTGRGFLIAWQSRETENSPTRIFYRRFDGEAEPTIDERAVTETQAEKDQFDPAAAVNERGDSLIVWREKARQSGSSQIMAQAYDASGVAQGNALIVSEPLGADTPPKVVAEPGGSWLICWPQDRDSRSILFGRRYQPNHAAFDGEARPLYAPLQARWGQPAIACDSGGGMLVGWQSLMNNDAKFAIKACRLIDRPIAAAVDQSRRGFPVTLTPGLPAGAAPPVALGPPGEIRSIEGDGAVASDAAGNFAVVSAVFPIDEQMPYVAVRLFDPNGAPRGGEFRADPRADRVQVAPVVTMNASGRFVVGWAEGSPAGNPENVQARIFDPDGRARGDAFSMNTLPVVNYGRIALHLNDKGQLIAGWNNHFGDSWPWSTFLRSFSADGAPTTNREFFAGDTASQTDTVAHFPTVTLDETGGLLVCWTVRPYDGRSHLNGQWFDWRGKPRGSSFLLSSYDRGEQLSPRSASDAMGNRIVVWMSGNQDGDGRGIFARRFDRFGIPLGGEFRVNAVTRGSQDSPAVAMTPDGRFAVAWHGPGPDGNFDIFVRRFAADGKPTTPCEFRLTDSSKLNHVSPSLACGDNGGLAVIWSDVDELSHARVIVSRIPTP